MRVPISEILQGVSAESGVPLEDLLGRCRLQGLVRARQVAYLLAREQGYSLPRIGRALGGRDHTTVLQGVQGVARAAANDPELFRLIEVVRARVTGDTDARAGALRRLQAAPPEMLARVADVLEARNG